METNQQYEYGLTKTQRQALMASAFYAHFSLLDGAATVLVVRAAALPEFSERSIIADRYGYTIAFCAPQDAFRYSEGRKRTRAHMVHVLLHAEAFADALLREQKPGPLSTAYGAFYIPDRSDAPAHVLGECILIRHLRALLDTRGPRGLPPWVQTSLLARPPMPFESVIHPRGKGLTRTLARKAAAELAAKETCAAPSGSGDAPKA